MSDSENGGWPPDWDCLSVCLSAGWRLRHRLELSVSPSIFFYFLICPFLLLSICPIPPSVHPSNHAVVLRSQTWKPFSCCCSNCMRSVCILLTIRLWCPINATPIRRTSLGRERNTHTRTHTDKQTQTHIQALQNTQTHTQKRLANEKCLQHHWALVIPTREREITVTLWSHDVMLWKTVIIEHSLNAHPGNGVQSVESCGHKIAFVLAHLDGVQPIPDGDEHGVVYYLSRGFLEADNQAQKKINSLKEELDCVQFCTYVWLIYST